MGNFFNALENNLRQSKQEMPLPSHGTVCAKLWEKYEGKTFFYRELND